VTKAHIPDLQEFIATLTAVPTAQPQECTAPAEISTRAVALSEQINHWHDARPVPDRWKPALLGRIAARFGATRELAAVALQHAGWRELRKAKHGASYWLPPTLFPNEEP